MQSATGCGGLQRATIPMRCTWRGRPARPVGGLNSSWWRGSGSLPLVLPAPPASGVHPETCLVWCCLSGLPAWGRRSTDYKLSDVPSRVTRCKPCAAGGLRWQAEPEPEPEPDPTHYPPPPTPRRRARDQPLPLPQFFPKLGLTPLADSAIVRPYGIFRVKRRPKWWWNTPGETEF